MVKKGESPITLTNYLNCLLILRLEKKGWIFYVLMHVFDWYKQETQEKCWQLLN